MKHTGRIDIRATALEPIVHGAGTSGNTQMLRMQDWIYEGRRVRVPFISGNSVKHKLRHGAVCYALDAMGVVDGTMTKAEVDLLFSGGHLSSTGASVDLRAARKIEELFPALSLCGYSAGNAMRESKVRVSNLHVVCAENKERLPDDLLEHPALQLKAGMLRIEEFGTRHDQATKAVGQRMLSAESMDAVVARKTKAKDDAKSAEEARGDSAQMIYEFQAIVAGATLWGDVCYADLTDLEKAALASAFHYSAVDRRGDKLVMGIGAKNSIGYGSIKVELRSSLRIGPPRYETETSLATGADDVAARYTAHLRERREEILAAVREAVA